MSEKTPARVVKVRIAVAVDREGQWNAAGWSTKEGTPADWAAMDIAIDAVGEAHYWITAELPVPGEVEIAGVIENET